MKNDKLRRLKEVKEYFGIIFIIARIVVEIVVLLNILNSSQF